MKSEYPTRHGDQHLPAGSDPIPGMSPGIQFNVFNGDDDQDVQGWLWVQTDDSTDHGYGELGMLLSDTSEEGIYIVARDAANTKSGSVLVTMDGLDLGTTDPAASISITSGHHVHINPTDTLDATADFIEFDSNTDAILQGNQNVTVRAVTNNLALRAGDALTGEADSIALGLTGSNNEIDIESSGVKVTLDSGDVWEIKDSSGNVKIRWTEGTNDLHIPTGGTIVADL